MFGLTGVDAGRLVGKATQGFLNFLGVDVRVRLKANVGAARNDVSFVVSGAMTKRSFVDACVVDKYTSRCQKAEHDGEVAEDFCCHGGFYFVVLLASY